MATTYSDSIAKVGRHVFGDAATYPIRKIELSDLGEALRLAEKICGAGTDTGARASATLSAAASKYYSVAQVYRACTT